MADSRIEPEALVWLLREALADMTPDERLSVFQQVAVNYCTHCGAVLDTMFCHCNNDD